MYLRQLEALLAVAEEGSFTAAADRLHTVQSNVSGHVQQLESELGVQLLVRGRRGAVPTEFGERVLDRARADPQRARARSARTSRCCKGSRPVTRRSASSVPSAVRSSRRSSSEMRRVAPGALAPPDRRRVRATRGRGRRPRARERGRDRAGLRPAPRRGAPPRRSSRRARPRRSRHRGGAGDACGVLRPSVDPSAARQPAPRRGRRRGAGRTRRAAVCRSRSKAFVSSPTSSRRRRACRSFPRPPCPTTIPRFAPFASRACRPAGSRSITARGVQLSLADQAVHDAVRGLRAHAGDLRVRDCPRAPGAVRRVPRG